MTYVLFLTQLSHGSSTRVNKVRLRKKIERWQEREKKLRVLCLSLNWPGGKEIIDGKITKIK